MLGYQMPRFEQFFPVDRELLQKLHELFETQLHRNLVVALTGCVHAAILLTTPAV